MCNEASPNEELNNQLKHAAAEVSRTLNDLLNHMRLGTKRNLRMITTINDCFLLASRERARESVQEHSVEEIYSATDKLSAAAGDPNEMVRQARRLGQATAHLIQSIKVFPWLFLSILKR